MNDGVYQGFEVLNHDLPIMCCESILYMFKIYDVDSLIYLEHIQHADILRP